LVVVVVVPKLIYSLVVICQKCHARLDDDEKNVANLQVQNMHNNLNSHMPLLIK
jgi:hypothetical protein